MAMTFRVGPTNRPQMVLITRRLRLRQGYRVVHGVFVQGQVGIPRPSHSKRSIRGRRTHRFFTTSLHRRPHSFYRFVPIRISRRLGQQIFLRGYFRHQGKVKVNVVPFFRIVLSRVVRRIVTVLFTGGFHRRLPSTRGSNLHISQGQVNGNFLQVNVVGRGLQLIIHPLLCKGRPTGRHLLVRLHLIHHNYQVSHVGFPRRHVVAHGLQPIMDALLLQRENYGVTSAKTVYYITNFILAVTESNFSPTTTLPFTIKYDATPINFTTIHRTILSTFLSTHLLVFRPYGLFGQ